MGVIMRRVVEVGLVLCLIGGVVLLAAFGPGALPIFTYHYERDLPPNIEGHFLVDVAGFRNCTLEISVINDSELLYEVDLELFRGGVEGDDFEVNYYKIDNIPNLQVRGYSVISTKKVTIIVGNALPPRFAISGHNLTSSISLGNNVIFNDQTALSYSDDGEDSGSLHLEVGSSLNITGFIQFRLMDIGTINLVVDLPEGVNGRLRYLAVESIQASVDGWYYSGPSDSYTYYETLNTAEPLLFFSIARVDTIVADLSS